MKDLVLHIGMPKTGTTALQYFLFENRHNLEKYGWSYPDIWGEFPKLQAFGCGVRTKNGSCLFKSNEELDINADNWIQVWKYLKEKLEKQNVILSLEEAYLWSPSELLAKMKEMYDNIKVIVYLRRQDRYIESIWNQSIKGEPCITDTFDEFVEQKKNSDNYRYFHKLEQLADIVGEENIIVRVYEKQQFLGEKKNIVSDFFCALGINVEWKDFSEVTIKNERLRSNYVEIKRIVNSLNIEDQATRDFYSDFFVGLSSTRNTNKNEDAYFSLDERFQFLKLFEEENMNVAKKYLNREDGILFYDKKVDYDQTIKMANSFEEDMIKTFVHLMNVCVIGQKKENDIFRQHNEFLRQQNRNLAERVIDTYRKDKPLVYFGAGDNAIKLLEVATHDVKCIIDNDVRKNGKSIKGVPVINPSQIDTWSQYFYLITCLETEDIEQQLTTYGLRKNDDYILARDIFVTLITW